MSQPNVQLAGLYVMKLGDGTTVRSSFANKEGELGFS